MASAKLIVVKMVVSRRASFKVPIPESRDGIAVKVEGLVLGRRDGLRAPNQLLGLPAHADLAHRLYHHWPGHGDQSFCPCDLEIFRGRGRTASKDLAGILHAQRGDGVPEDRLGRRGGSFGCAVMLSKGVNLLTFTSGVLQLSPGIGGFRKVLVNQRC
jgi:hypothetical protein